MTLTLPGLSPAPTSIQIRRGLTLTQPWAGLVASGIKLIENRPRKIISPSDFGKPFAIHASREISKDAMRRIIEIAPEHGDPRLPWFRLASITSAIVGIATIDRVIEMRIEPGQLSGTFGMSEFDFDDDDGHDDSYGLAADQRRWFFGPIGYALRDVRPLKEPVPCKGALGFWGLSESIAMQVTAQLEDA